jgi:hypothetical protein
MKGQIKALDDGDLRPDQVKHIATKLGGPEDDVVSMNRRLGGYLHSGASHLLLPPPGSGPSADAYLISSR